MKQGFFIDWNGDVRMVGCPGDGYHCNISEDGKSVEVCCEDGEVVFEAVLYKNEEEVKEAFVLHIGWEYDYPVSMRSEFELWWREECNSRLYCESAWRVWKASRDYLYKSVRIIWSS